MFWGFYDCFWRSVSSLFALTRTAAWDRAIGELSYPVYICHILIMAVIDRAVGMQVAAAVGPAGWLALNITSVMAFSWACVRFIQMPFDALRYRIAFGRRHPTTAAARPA